MNKYYEKKYLGKTRCETFFIYNDTGYVSRSNSPDDIKGLAEIASTSSSAAALYFGGSEIELSGERFLVLDRANLASEPMLAAVCERIKPKSWE